MDTILQALYANRRDPALVLSQERVVFANAEAKRTFGADIEGTCVQSLLGEGTQALLCLKAGESTEDTLVYNGRFLPYRALSFGPYTVLETGLTDDLTPESKRLLNFSDRVVRSSLSHIIPYLHSVSRFAQTSKNPELLHASSVIYRHCLRVLRLCDNTTMLIALREGKAAGTITNIDVFAYLREYAEKCAALLCGDGAELSLTGADGHLVAGFDTDKLERLFYLLVSHCLGHEGVAHVRLNACVHEGELSLIFSDDGAHAAADTAVVDLAEQRCPEDLALELPLAAAIATYHGGRLLLSGGEESGNRVSVILPLKSCETGYLSSMRIDYSGGIDIAQIELSPFIGSDKYKF